MADISKLFATASLKVELQGVGEIELILRPPDPIELAKIRTEHDCENLELIEEICARHIVDWKNVEYEGRAINIKEKIGEVEALRRVLRALTVDNQLVMTHVIRALSDKDFFLKNSSERSAS